MTSAMLPLAADITEDLSLLHPPDLQQIVRDVSLAILGLTVLVLLAVLVRRRGPAWRRRFRAWWERPRPVKAPHRRALKKLRKLENRAHELAPRVFASEVALVLREYLEERFGLHATRQASEEVLEEAKRRAVLTDAHAASLRDILAAADNDKFFHTEPIEANHRLLETARRFVGATEGPGVAPPVYEHIVTEVLAEPPW